MSGSSETAASALVSFAWVVGERANRAKSARTRKFRREQADATHPEGMKACSRWLSVATPPEKSRSCDRTPAGVLALFERRQHACRHASVFRDESGGVASLNPRL